MRIEPEEFEPLSSELRVGQSMRADHACGMSPKTLSITRYADRIVAYCYRCGGKGLVRLQESLRDRLHRMQVESSADAEAQRSTQLPAPQVHTLADWPKDAALWLYRTGFSPSMIEKLGAYWCPAIGRVVLPVVEDGHAVFWQARATKRLPKILSPNMPRQGIVGKYGTGETLVLCEDTLSAYKVGQITEAWSLLGTKLLDRPLSRIIERGGHVVVWLDSDEAGKRGAARIVRTLRAYGITVRDVVTPKDPKHYDRAFIKEILHA